MDVRADDDVWLAGTTSATGTSVTGLVMHFDGMAWKKIDVPGSLGVPGYQGTLHRIVADSPTNVYVLRVRQNAQIPRTERRAVESVPVPCRVLLREHEEAATEPPFKDALMSPPWDGERG